MKYFKVLSLVLFLSSASVAHAQSDAYYSQGLYMDFKLAEEDESLKANLESFLTRLAQLMNGDTGESLSISFDYLTESDS